MLEEIFERHTARALDDRRENFVRGTVLVARPRLKAQGNSRETLCEFGERLRLVPELVESWRPVGNQTSLMGEQVVNSDGPVGSDEGNAAGRGAPGLHLDVPEFWNESGGWIGETET